jgi:hypothetical protein
MVTDKSNFYYDDSIEQLKNRASAEELEISSTGYGMEYVIKEKNGHKKGRRDQ